MPKGAEVGFRGGFLEGPPRDTYNHEPAVFYDKETHFTALNECLYIQFDIGHRTSIKTVNSEERKQRFSIISTSSVMEADKSLDKKPPISPRSGLTKRSFLGKGNW
jgi:hypothetical protein